jgi:hypothetical protein
LFIREEGTKRKKRRRRKKSKGRSMRPQTGTRVQGNEGIIVETVETNAYGPLLGAGSTPPSSLPSANKDIPSSYTQKQKN